MSRRDARAEHGFIDLYGMTSPNVLKVSIMLEELGAPYRFHYVNVVAGEQFSPEFTALSPLGKVPVIVDHDENRREPAVVFESGAILLYLAEKHGRFIPKAPALRLQTIQWLMVQMAQVGPLLGQLTHFVRFAPAGNDYSTARYRTLAGRVYDALETRLSGGQPYLAGQPYTVADIATYPWVSLYHDKHGMDWGDHPHLKAWCDRVAARPAVARADASYAARELDDPSMRPGADQDGVDRFFGWGAHTRS
jgi:GST-like protein